MTSPRFAYISEWSPQSETRLESVALAALQARGLLPTRPCAISIERLIEEAFGFSETYEDLAPGVLGEIYFGVEDRPIAIRIALRLGIIDSSALSIDQERRMTLAHECGHGLVHSHFFSARLRALREPRLPGFETDLTHFICREEDISSIRHRPVESVTSVRTLEWEANYLMAALLLPRPLLISLLDTFLRSAFDGVSPLSLPAANRDAAVTTAADAFDVPKELAGWRIDSLFLSEAHPDFFPIKPSGNSRRSAKTRLGHKPSRTLQPNINQNRV
jgi:hypothetical protein